MRQLPVLIGACLLIVTQPLTAEADDFVVPSIEDAIAKAKETIEKVSDKTGKSDENSASKEKKDAPKLSSVAKDDGKKVPVSKVAQAGGAARHDSMSSIARPDMPSGQVHARKSTSLKLPPKPPTYEETVARAVPKNDGGQTKAIEPVVIGSSDETHILKAAGLYQNTLIMPEDIQNVFSSRKISVEIRGPIAIFRFPSMAGSEVDVQIIQKNMKVENFIFRVDNRLPAQKFIVKASMEDAEDGASASRNGVVKPRAGGAIDTLITIANGKKPIGFKPVMVSDKSREYLGLRIREVLGYRKLDKLFMVYALTNETSEPVRVSEWNLHNSAVLGDVEHVKAVKMMSLDTRLIQPGKTTLMYVGFLMPRKVNGYGQ